jgi:hypothetical protein
VAMGPLRVMMLGGLMGVMALNPLVSCPDWDERSVRGPSQRESTEQQAQK